MLGMKRMIFESEKISLTYNQELFSVFDNMPRPIINFNDVELLKKAQLYIRHTDRVFNKAIASVHIFIRMQIYCFYSKTPNVPGVDEASMPTFVPSACRFLTAIPTHSNGYSFTLFPSSWPSVFIAPS